MTSAITASNGSSAATPIGGVAAGQQSAALGASGGFAGPGLRSPVRSGPGSFAGLLTAKERLHLTSESEQSAEEAEQNIFGAIDPKIAPMEEEDGNSSGGSTGQQNRGSFRVVNQKTAAVAASVSAQAEDVKRELAEHCALARPDAERAAILAAKTFILAVDAYGVGAIQRPALFATMQTIRNELANARLCLPETPAELLSIVNRVRDGLPPVLRAFGGLHGEFACRRRAPGFDLAKKECCAWQCVHPDGRHGQEVLSVDHAFSRSSLFICIVWSWGHCRASDARAVAGWLRVAISRAHS